MAQEPVFVVGGGTMGRGIAAICALRGFPTAVFEADSGTRAGLRQAIEASWSRAGARGKLSADDVRSAGERLSIASTLAGAAGSAVVVEAVTENLALKQEIFRVLDVTCPPPALLTSNTSSLPIGRIAEGLEHPERVLGLHFFNPVTTVPLVEVVRTSETAPEAERRAVAFAEALGKQVVRVRDAPGFATSRLGVALGLEAMRMVEEGVAEAADIDRAMELGYGHRMGPLKTSDLVGLDVRLAIAETLAAELDARRFEPPALLRRMVDEGRTGKKAGRGFYAWDREKPVPLTAERGASEGGEG
ncbi:MAG: 3-hydroxyacyl-CoA dehydrogenase family protein [Thermoanaerobaculia bacterium]